MILWIVFALLLIICIISEYIQAKNKTNNGIRTSFFICVFIYHILSIQGSYMDYENIMTYPLSYWIGFFLPGIIMTIVEIWALFKSLNNGK